MQGIHVMHRNFEHDLAVVRSHRSDGLGQIRNFLPLRNALLRLHESHEPWKLTFFEHAHNEDVFHDFFLKERAQILAPQFSTEAIGPMTQTGQTPNTFNPDLDTLAGRYG